MKTYSNCVHVKQYSLLCTGTLLQSAVWLGYVRAPTCCISLQSVTWQQEDVCVSNYCTGPQSIKKTLYLGSTIFFRLKNGLLVCVKLNLIWSVLREPSPVQVLGHIALINFNNLVMWLPKTWERHTCPYLQNNWWRRAIKIYLHK